MKKIKNGYKINIIPIIGIIKINKLLKIFSSFIIMFLLLRKLNIELDNNVIIGVREGGEKLLVKSEDEYTSPIAKIYKIQNEYIILTENSLYIASAKIASKRIS